MFIVRCAPRHFNWQWWYIMSLVHLHTLYYTYFESKDEIRAIFYWPMRIARLREYRKAPCFHICMTALSLSIERWHSRGLQRQPSSVPLVVRVVSVNCQPPVGAALQHCLSPFLARGSHWLVLHLRLAPPTPHTFMWINTNKIIIFKLLLS